MIIDKQLQNFIDDEGRLKRYPAKFKIQISALFYLASKFEHGKRYTEKEVNEILQKWHIFEDWCLLRRELCDRQFLGREKNCTFYWIEDKQPTLTDFKLD